MLRKSFFEAQRECMAEEHWIAKSSVVGSPRLDLYRSS